jgi:hypothetical protein
MAMQWKSEQPGATPPQPENANLTPGPEQDPVQGQQFETPEFAPIDGAAEPPAFQDFPAAVGDR